MREKEREVFGGGRGRGSERDGQDEVRRDLTRYDLLASEEKSEWGARRNVI